MKIFGLRKRFYIPPLLALLFGYCLAFYYPHIEVNHVYKVLPVFTIYTEKTLNLDQAGTCRGIIILIRPSCKDDTTVKIHELVHARQAYKSFFFYWLIAAVDDEYLAKIECEAYATEIVNSNQIPIIARLIQTEYTPNVRYDIIEDYLMEYYKEPIIKKVYKS